MSVCIVEQLEAIQVQQQHCGAFPESLGTLEGLPEPVREQRPVGQSGEGIMHGLVVQSLTAFLGRLLLAQGCVVLSDELAEFAGLLRLYVFPPTGSSGLSHGASDLC